MNGKTKNKEISNSGGEPDAFFSRADGRISPLSVQGESPGVFRSFLRAIFIKLLTQIER
jgi:hypothetical protein